MTEPLAGPPRPAGPLLVAAGLSGGAWTTFAAVGAGVLRTPASMFALLCWGALVLLGTAARTTYRRSAAWSALALVGFGLSLQLVDAGTRVVYQHLRPAVTPLVDADWLLIGGLVSYAALVAGGLLAHARTFRAWIVEQLGVGRTVVVVLVWAAIGASPLRDLGAFALEIVLAAALALVALGAVALAAVSLPAELAERLSRKVEAVVGDESRGPWGIDRIVWGAAAFAAVASASLAYWIWEAHPRIADEVSFLYQAQYFATGALAAPGVPVPELFVSYQIECTVEQCISVLQPGWPAVLAVGVLLGVPWLINPLLTGVNVLLLFAFLRELYGTRLARGASLLLACSPWYLFLGMSYMNHQAALLGGLVGVWGAATSIRRGSPAWAALAGVGAGFASFMRPLDGVIVGVVAGLPLLLFGTFSLGRRLAAAAAFGGCAIVVGSLNLAYNYAVTGDPTNFPVTSYVNALWGEGTNNLGFGPDRGVYPLWAQMDAFPGHSPFQAVVNAGLNVTALQVDLFGWAIGSFLPVLLLFALWRLRGRDWLMVAWIGIINALYALYWFASGPDFAARYWFLAIVPFVALSARGIGELASWAEARAPARGRAGVGLAVLLLTAQTLLVFLPWRSTDKYFRYWETAPTIRDALARDLLPDGVYLVQGANHPDYAATIVYTGPDLASGDVVFAYDSLPNSALRLREAYPEKRIWLMDGPTATGTVYGIVGVAGP